jgi:5-methylcytosine-specific restriction endonuclease McrA
MPAAAAPRSRRRRQPELDTREWRRIRADVLARDGYRCQLNLPRCTGLATTVDHIIARHHGGPLLDPANLRAACRPCNSVGGAAITNDARAGRSLGQRSRIW